MAVDECRENPAAGVSEPALVLMLRNPFTNTLVLLNITLDPESIGIIGTATKTFITRHMDLDRFNRIHLGKFSHCFNQLSPRGSLDPTIPG